VTISNLAGTAAIVNNFGNVTTHSVEDSRVCVRTVTGDITATRTDKRVNVDLQATTVTGHIRP
jgi:hypothetical protein